MRRAIRKHLRDFVAMMVLVAMAVGIGGYILTQQRLRFPILEEAPFRVKAEFVNARGVMPGQGQTIRVAGMRVGDIGKVELENGRAIVTMDLDAEYDDLVHADATALLRPRTGLKDMFVALDPGTKAAPLLKENERIPVKNTLPDVNPDEILSVLDADTRDYLKLLISGVGKGLKGRGGDLREVFRRLGPLHRDIARLGREVAKRRENLARLIHNYGSTVDRLSKEDRELAELVSSARRVFESLAREDERISLAVSRLPSALSQTERTLGKVQTLAETAGPAFDSLRPAVRRIDDANRKVLPFAREAEPAIRTQIRPFVRTARPYLEDLRPAATNLAQASPDLRESFYELNRFFNMGAYNPGGAEKLTGDAQKDLARDEGMLFWLAWVSHNTVSLFNTSDAQGPYRRGILSVTCTTLQGLAKDEPLAAVITGATNLLAPTGACPAD